eukprot:354244-Chlamydomonas_euryale.AAC.1
MPALCASSRYVAGQPSRCNCTVAVCLGPTRSNDMLRFKPFIICCEGAPALPASPAPPCACMSLTPKAIAAQGGVDEHAAALRELVSLPLRAPEVWGLSPHTTHAHLVTTTHISSQITQELPP